MVKAYARLVFEIQIDIVKDTDEVICRRMEEFCLSFLNKGLVISDIGLYYQKYGYLGISGEYCESPKKSPKKEFNGFICRPCSKCRYTLRSVKHYPCNRCSFENHDLFEVTEMAYSKRSVG